MVPDCFLSSILCPSALLFSPLMFSFWQHWPWFSSIKFHFFRIQRLQVLFFWKCFSIGLHGFLPPFFEVHQCCSNSSIKSSTASLSSSSLKALEVSILFFPLQPKFPKFSHTHTHTHRRDNNIRALLLRINLTQFLCLQKKIVNSELSFFRSFLCFSIDNLYILFTQWHFVFFTNILNICQDYYFVTAFCEFPCLLCLFFQVKFIILLIFLYIIVLCWPVLNF